MDDRISWPHHARVDGIHTNCPTQLGGVHKLIPQETQNILHSLLTSVGQTVKRWPTYKHHAGTCKWSVTMKHDTILRVFNHQSQWNTIRYYVYLTSTSYQKTELNKNKNNAVWLSIKICKVGLVFQLANALGQVSTDCIVPQHMHLGYIRISWRKSQRREKMYTREDLHNFSFYPFFWCWWLLFPYGNKNSYLECTINRSQTWQTCFIGCCYMKGRTSVVR